MRQIDIHLKSRDSDVVLRAVKAAQPVDYIVFPLEQRDRTLIRVIMHDGRAQKLADAIQSSLESCRDWRITVLPVQTTLPAPPELDEDEASEDLQILREELLADVSRDAALTRDFLILTALSTVVAAIGMNSDGVAAVIGAMVIAPLLGPILGFSLAAGLGKTDLLRESTLTLAAGISVALVVSFAICFFVELNLESDQLMSRARVSLDGVALALAAGGAAALSMARGQSAVLVGVMVAAALLPPGAAFGLFMGGAEYTLAMRAGLLLALNIVCLVLSALVVFRLKNIRPRAWLDQQNANRATLINAVISITFLAGLIALIIILDLGSKVDIPGS